MNKRDIINFFDKLACGWDKDQIIDEDIISKILDMAKIKENSTVLDVACGTGVLFPYYLDKKVKKIFGIDISKNMTEIAKEKFSNENIEIICGDALEYDFNEKFDNIMIYNAFPHFTEPEKLISKLSDLLKPEGTLTVAHSMSKKELDALHMASAGSVSLLLPEVEELAKMFSINLKVTSTISNNSMYLVTGKK